MRNIAFLVVIIITVAFAVSCNIQKSADKKESKVTVSEKQENGSNKPSGFFSKVIERDNEDILRRLTTLEENLNQKIESINLTVDNTNVIQKLDDINASVAKSQADVLTALTATNVKNQKLLYQTLSAILAAVIAIIIVQILVFRYLKRFIAESMLIASYKNSTNMQMTAPTVENGEESPVLSAINKVVTNVNAKISEGKNLFDPEKAVKLDAAQKNALTQINSEISFLKKAGYQLTSKQQYLIAVEKINDKNYSDATQILEDIKTADENFSLAFFMSGYIAYVSRKYDTAIENLEKACKLEPENAAYLISYGNACLKEKKYKEAATALKKAVEIKPDDASAWNNLAHVYIMSEKLKEAVEAFTKATDIKPDFHEALHNLGLALGKLEKYEEALVAFEKAITAKEDKHESMYNAACVYAILGKRDGALTNLKKAIALLPDYAAKAKKDKDFKSFKDDEEFKKIVG